MIYAAQGELLCAPEPDGTTVQVSEAVHIQANDKLSLFLKVVHQHKNVPTCSFRKKTLKSQSKGMN